MSVKETVHQWIEELPEDSSELQALYDHARLEAGIGKAMEDVRAGRMLSYEELIGNYEERCRERRTT